MPNPESPILLCPCCGSSRTRMIGGRGVCFACEADLDPDELLSEDTIGGEPLQAATLFVSYDPLDAEIGHRIVESLRKRGHTVRTDAETLPSGDSGHPAGPENPSEIQGIVACLSRRSVREPGTCLEELALALGTCGASLQTVLLEPERFVNPPPTLCTSQWVDMSGWKIRLAKGGEDFQSWFEEKMDQLARAVENPRRPSLDGEIAELKKRLHPSCGEGRERDLLGQPFTGRAWLEERIYGWLEAPNGGPVCLLFGDPGVGKSAFAARFLHRNPRAAAGLFCDATELCYKDSQDLCVSLAYRLACHIPDYRMALLFATEKGPRYWMKSEISPLDLLLELSEENPAEEGPRDTLCLVLDGLDDCDQEGQKTILDLLALWSRRLPSWLRILVTARGAASVKAAIPDVFCIHLGAEGIRNLADVNAYFGERLGGRFRKDPAWPAARKALVQSSGGVFLRARLLAEGLLDGHLSLNAPASFPADLFQTFHSRFARSFPDIREYQEVWRPFLEMLLASPEPLPLAEFGRVAGGKAKRPNGLAGRIRELLRKAPDNDEDRPGEFLRRMEGLLRRDRNAFGEETLAFRHRSLVKWLQMDLDQQPYAASAAAGRVRMAEAIGQLADSDPGNLTAYESLHLFHFLKDADLPSEAWKPILRAGLLRQVLRWGDLCVAMGDLTTAEEYRGMATILANRQVRQKSGTDVSLFGKTRDRAAVLRRSRNRPDEAFRLLQKRSSGLTNLIRENPEARDRLALSVCRERMADILNKEETGEEALRLVREAIDLREDLLREAQDHRLRLYLSFSLRRAGDLLAALEQPEEALSSLEKATALVRQIPDRELSSAYLEHLSGCLVRQVELLAEGNRPEDALALCRENEEILRTLLPERPDADVLKNLKELGYRIGIIRTRQGQHNESLAICRQIVALDEALLRKNPLPEATRNLALSLEAVGATLETLGDLDQALACFRRGAGLQESLADVLPTFDLQLPLTMLWEHSGSVLEKQGRSEEALAYDRKSIQVRQELLQKEPNHRILWELSLSYQQTGDLLNELGRLDEALVLFRNGKALTEELLRQVPLPEFRHRLSLWNLRVGEVQNRQGKRKEALERCREATSLAEQLTQESDDPSFRETLVSCMLQLVRVLTDLGQLNEATDHAREAMELAVQLVRERSTPDRQIWLRDSCRSLAELQATQARWVEALKLHQKALELDEQLAREYPVPGRLHALCESCLRMGENLGVLGQGEESGSCYRRAKELADRLLRESPSPAHREIAAFAAECVADTLAGEGSWEEALGLFQEAISLRQQVVQDTPTPDHKAALSDDFTALASLLQTHDRPEEALDLYQASRAIFQQLVRDDPSPQNLDGLGQTCYNVAETLFLQGRAEEALPYYEKAETLLRQLVQGFPQPYYERHLSDACLGLGRCLAGRGERERAISLLEEAQSLLESLLQTNPLPEFEEDLADVRAALEQLGL